MVAATAAAAFFSAHDAVNSLGGGFGGSKHRPAHERIERKIIRLAERAQRRHRRHTRHGPKPENVFGYPDDGRRSPTAARSRLPRHRQLFKTSPRQLTAFGRRGNRGVVRRTLRTTSTLIIHFEFVRRCCIRRRRLLEKSLSSAPSGQSFMPSQRDRLSCIACWGRDDTFGGSSLRWECQ